MKDEKIVFMVKNLQKLAEASPGFDHIVQKVNFLASPRKDVKSKRFSINGSEVCNHFWILNRSIRLASHHHLAMESIYCLTEIIISKRQPLLKSFATNKHHIFTSNLENLDCNLSKIKSAFATGFYFDLLFTCIILYTHIRKMHEQFRFIYNIQQHTNERRDGGKKVKCVSRGVHIETINLKFWVYRKTILPHIYKLKCIMYPI